MDIRTLANKLGMSVKGKSISQMHKQVGGLLSKKGLFVRKFYC